MSDIVKIKSFPHGINIILSNEANFEEIIAELSEKFSEGRSFFGKASLAISISGRAVTEDDEKKIISVIRDNCDLNVICVVGHDDERDKNYIKAIQQVEKRLSEAENCRFYKGNLKDGDVLNAEGNIVILGDVYPGCVVTSPCNIIVLGGLYGEAMAGVDGDTSAFVYALELSPQNLTIGEFKYISKDKNSIWGIRPKVQPKIAYLEDERVIAKPLTKELLASM